MDVGGAVDAGDAVAVGGAVAVDGAAGVTVDVGPVGVPGSTEADSGPNEELWSKASSNALRMRRCSHPEAGKFFFSGA